MAEEWVTYPGYEDKYMGSTEGRVKSLPRLDYSGTRLRGRILKPSLNPQGYQVVNLWKNGEDVMHTVHKIIARCFLPPDPTRNCINHKNGIRHDNRLSNLERVTYSENHIHAYRVLGRKNGMKGKLSEHRKIVMQKSLSGDIVNEFASITDAEKNTKIHRRNIAKCLKGERNQAGGYAWIEKKHTFIEI